MILDMKKKNGTLISTISEVDTPACGASRKIQSIQRYSAYVMIQYDNCVEFVQFERRSVLDSVSKIYLKEKIINV